MDPQWPALWDHLRLSLFWGLPVRDFVACPLRGKKPPGRGVVLAAFQEPGIPQPVSAGVGRRAQLLSPSRVLFALLIYVVKILVSRLQFYS